MLVAAVLVMLCTAAFAQKTDDWLPPWNPPPAGGEHFSVPPFDAVADLHGDVVDPQLTVFFAGNQFMVVHDLVAAFKQAYLRYQRVFVETLPPGILARHIEKGSLVMVNLRIAARPDICTAGKGAIAERRQQHHWFAETADCARNGLAILVAKGNPKHIDTIAIPAAQNEFATYTAALMRDAPHPQAAKDFFAFMESPPAQAIYRKYGFQAPRS